MFALPNLSKILIEILFVLALVGIGYWYFTYSQDKIQTLEANQAKLLAAVTEQTNTINSLQKFMNDQAANISNLQSSMSDAEAAKAKTETQVNQDDLAGLARKNPSDLEKRINDDSKKALQDLLNSIGGGK